MKPRTRISIAALAALAALPALTGCSLLGTAAYGPDERTITVDAGDEFTLTVPAKPTLGQNWYLADPRPDADVLKYRGRREESSNPNPGAVGSSEGSQYFDFTARKAGTTTVKLLFCPYGSCHGTSDGTPGPSGTPTPTPTPTASGTPSDSDDRPAYYLYDVTVR